MSRRPVPTELAMWRENGQRIREWRTRRGHSQAALAEAAGVTQGALSNYEAGKRELPLTTALRVAAALDVSLADVVAVPEVIVLRDSRLGRAVDTLTRRPELLESLTDGAPGVSGAVTRNGDGRRRTEEDGRGAAGNTHGRRSQVREPAGRNGRGRVESGARERSG